ncbi:MAG: hypothetical protein KDE56_14685 [Anaerolineales bacterium]|nr:hypothetical protein [Anaerolineales bacterium]
MNRFLRPATLIPAIFGFLLAILLDVVVNTIAGLGGQVLTAVFILTLLFGLLALWFSARPQPTRVMIEPVPLDTPANRLIHARRGLIAFVSLYQPNAQNPQAQGGVDVARRVTAAQKGDYEALNLENSNLAAIIATITAHAYRLEHCWLIATTTGSPDTSSLTYLPPLIAYLQNKHGLQIQYHTGTNYAIRIDRDDALITNQTRSLVNRIYEEAHSLKLAERDVVADFSGGYRSMTLGMILACLNKGRDIQFAGTRYDANARPTGEIFPILFNFEAELEQRG